KRYKIEKVAYSWVLWVIKMKTTKSIIFLILGLLLFSCGNQQTDKAETNISDSAKTITIDTSSVHLKNEKTLSQTGRHKDLLYFSSSYVMEMDDLYDLSDSEIEIIHDDFKFNQKTDTITYKKDTIYISYLTYVNACAEYDGNIKFNRDTLTLKAF